MTQTAIPFLFMRGGTSRGPYFHSLDLPCERNCLAEILLAVVGSGHPLNIDGVGGGATVTTKVAMLSRSEDSWADIDYFFAQLAVEERLVDFKPTCGNILTAVGPAAIEMGLMAAQKGETLVKIRCVNTGARVEAKVQTPDGIVAYEGGAVIDGVPGAAAPVEMRFMDVVGGMTGAFLPTGNLRDVIDGVEVTCMDVAMPMVIARAADFGLAGGESCDALNADKELYARMESIRTQAGPLMGMGNVAKSVTPKFGLLAPARQGGSLAARYFTPWNCHPGMAVTGAQCLAACTLTPGTIAHGLSEIPAGIPAEVVIEHPAGKISVLVDYRRDGKKFILRSAGLIRTARKLAQGEVFVPSSVWNGERRKP